ncbi:MAG: FAD/NAD(P)-binding protein [Anaerolineales bacterium]|nr:FAD/NAD(P)-binding protein [Anaerolineales bacterium]
MSIPAIESIYVPTLAWISKVEPMTATEKFFTVELPRGQSLGHKPGQFVQISLNGIGEAPISISSSPSRSNGKFEMCVRKVGDVTSALHNMNEGAQIGVRGPYGRGFPVEQFEGRDILVAAGGLSLAPVRSVINQIFDNRKKYGRFIILYGAKNPGELLFKEERDEWTKRGDVEFLETVDKGTPEWTGNVGVITTLFPKITVNPRNTVAIAEGPPIMYRFVLMELLGKGIPEDQIWVSLERRMKCGVGKCGHCQLDHFYCCQNGPSFSYAEIKGVMEAL